MVTKKKTPKETPKEIQKEESNPEKRVLTSADVEKVRESNLSESDRSAQLQEVFARQTGDERELARLGKPSQVKRTLIPEEEALAARLPQFTPEQEQKSIITGQKPQGVLGTALYHSPLGFVQQVTGLPLLDVQTGDVERIGRTVGAVAAAFALTGGVALTGGALALATSKTAIGSLLSKFAGRLTTGALLGIGATEAINFLTGNKSGLLIGSYTQAGNAVIQGLSDGTIDYGTALSEIERIRGQVNELEGSFQVGSREIFAAFTQGGKDKIEDIKRLQLLADGWDLQLADFAEQQRALRRSAIAFSQRGQGAGALR